MSYCVKCGQKNSDDASFCAYCGENIGSVISEPVIFSTAKVVPEDQIKRGIGPFGIISLACGVISLLSYATYSFIFAVIFSIVAIVMGIISLVKKYSKKGFAIAGLITGGQSLILCLLIVIVLLIYGEETLLTSIQTSIQDGCQEIVNGINNSFKVIESIIYTFTT